LTERQEQILLSLKKLTFLSRTQISTIHKLGKVRNANRILADMRYYINNFRDGYDTVYHLNSFGKEYVQSKRTVRRNQYARHTLMRNQFFVFAGCPKEWKNEIKISDGKATKVCDSWFKVNEYQHILEVDHLQSMNENANKIKAYSEMQARGVVKKKLGYFPPIVWVTTTELRKKQITKLCEQGKLNYRVYTEEEIR